MLNPEPIRTSASAEGNYLIVVASDYESDIAEYAAAKARIFERQDAEDFAILPADAPDLRELIVDDATVVLFDGRSVAREIWGTRAKRSLRVPTGSFGGRKTLSIR